MRGYCEGETVTRRRLFTGGAMAAGGIATAAIALPAIGFALGPVFKEEEVTYQDVGAVSDFSADNYVPRTITLTAGVGEAGEKNPHLPQNNSPPPGGEAGAVAPGRAQAARPRSSAP